MYIDTHSHLNDDILFNDIENVISMANKNSVEIIICASYDFKSIKRALEICDKYANVYCTIGFHPENCSDYNSEMELYLNSIISNPKVVAVGEIGLDYHYNSDNKELQKSVFVKQIKLANKYNKPIVVHTRDAIFDTLNIIEENKKYINKCVIHCFSESKEIAKKILDMGLYVSIGGVVTFQNSKNLTSIIPSFPLDKIMLETDCPYLAPVPYRGQINYPKYIPLIATKIAELKNVTVEQIEIQTTNNAKFFFGV